MPQTKSKLRIVLAVALVALVAVSAGYYLTSSNMTGYAQLSSSQYGQTNGYSVNVASKSGLGSYLVNGTGFTLYTFMRDVQNSGTSACAAGCSDKWPAFYVSNLALPSSLSASSFTVITRPDGSKQLAYDGWPLYYFGNDMNPGDVNGQGVGNVWFACTVPTPFSDVSSAATTTTPSGSGW